MSELPGKFNANPNRVYLSGKSAGGVLVHAALCKSGTIASKVKVAVDILGEFDFLPRLCLTEFDQCVV